MKAVILQLKSSNYFWTAAEILSLLCMQVDKKIYELNIYHENSMDIMTKWPGSQSIKNSMKSKFSFEKVCEVLSFI